MINDIPTKASGFKYTVLLSVSAVFLIVAAVFAFISRENTTSRITQEKDRAGQIGSAFPISNATQLTVYSVKSGRVVKADFIGLDLLNSDNSPTATPGKRGINFTISNDNGSEDFFYDLANEVYNQDRMGIVLRVCRQSDCPHFENIYQLSDQQRLDILNEYYNHVTAPNQTEYAPLSLLSFIPATEIKPGDQISILETYSMDGDKLILKDSEIFISRK